MALQKNKLKNGMVFHMKTTIKRLEKLARDVIKIVHEVNDIYTNDLNLLSRRLTLLKELTNTLPAISELINQIQLEDQKDNIGVGMTTDD